MHTYDAEPGTPIRIETLLFLKVIVSKKEQYLQVPAYIYIYVYRICKDPRIPNSRPLKGRVYVGYALSFYRFRDHGPIFQPYVR